MNVFEYRSVIPVRAADVFRWHERPEALFALMPSSRLIRIERRVGGIRDGGEVSFSFGIGRLRLRWDARHFGFIPGTRFCDEQVRGPFALWRHTHTVYPIATDVTVYEDHVEYSLPGGRLVNRVLEPFFRVLLAHAFATRHRVVHERLTGGAGSNQIGVRLPAGTWLRQAVRANPALEPSAIDTSSHAATARDGNTGARL